MHDNGMIKKVLISLHHLSRLAPARSKELITLPGEEIFSRIRLSKA